MKVLSGSCHLCDAHVDVPLEALLVAVDDADRGWYAYICPVGGHLVDSRLSNDGLAILLAAGVKPIEIGEHDALLDDDHR